MDVFIIKTLCTVLVILSVFFCYQQSQDKQVEKLDTLIISITGILAAYLKREDLPKLR